MPRKIITGFLWCCVNNACKTSAIWENIVRASSSLWACCRYFVLMWKRRENIVSCTVCSGLLSGWLLACWTSGSCCNAHSMLELLETTWLILIEAVLDHLIQKHCLVPPLSHRDDVLLVQWKSGWSVAYNNVWIRKPESSCFHPSTMAQL